MTYKTEIRRTLTETAYYSDYRFAEGKRGTWLDLKCDILEPLIEAELSGGPEVSVGGDWLERFAPGRWKKDSGEHYYTIPGSERLQLIERYLERNGYDLPLILTDHNASVQDATSILDERGYRFADATLLSGTFRGVFSGAAEVDYGLTEVILFICLVPGEDLFRTRIIETNYFDEDASNNELDDRFASMNFNGWFVSDLFATFGTNTGRIFGEEASHSGYRADDFDFFSRGRRVSAFTLSQLDDLRAPVRMQLCRKPDSINRMRDVCKSVHLSRQRCHTGQ